jgi:hypothetical protein
MGIMGSIQVYPPDLSWQKFIAVSIYLIGYKVTGIPKISQVDRLVGIKRMCLRMMNSNSGLWVGPRVGLLKTHQNGSSIDAKTSCSMLFRIVSSVPNSVPQITA